MSTIITRSGKGSLLTPTEVDTNFTNLNTDKADKASPVFTGDASFGAGTPVKPVGFNKFIAIGDTDSGIGQISDGLIAIVTNGAERVRLDSIGNVTVGAPVPLEAYGRKTLSVQDATGGLIEIGSTSGKHGIAYFNESGNTLSIEARSTNTELTLTSNGTGSIKLAPGSSGSVVVVSPSLLGYGTGSGGTVTQATSKSTSVTLNKPSGQITMNAGALAAGATVTFDFNNSLLGNYDVMILSGFGAAFTHSTYNYWVSNLRAGFTSISVKNISVGSLSEALVLNFAIIKGSVS